MSDDTRNPIPADIQSLADYERHALLRLPADVAAHIQAGADADITLADNRRAFERLRFMPRVLVSMRQASTEIELFGERHVAPILLAPVAYQKLVHPHGELETVRAAAAMQAGMVVSTLSSIRIEELAQASAAAATELGRPAGPLWFQLYFQPRREDTLDLVKRAVAAGYQALVVTVDAAFKRSGFALPAGVDAVNLHGYARLPVQPGSALDPAILLNTPLAQCAPTWEDIRWLRACVDVPILIKGVLSPADAHEALKHGVDGLVVSNHGGRVLDGPLAAIDALGAIVDAVRGAVPVLMDGGVRRGTDVVKALAMGAAAVLVGRPQVHALAVGGLQGVVHALYLLRAETELAMAQLGRPTIQDLDRSCFDLQVPAPCA